MSKAERDAALNDLSSKIFSAMLGEIILDTAIQTHREIVRSKRICNICNTRCGQAHMPTISASTQSGSQTDSAQAAQDGTASQPGTSASNGGKSDGNINLDCVNCQRPIASNRYAQHLANCLGIGAGVRRTVQRNAVAKTKMSANGRSASPYVDSVNDGILDEPKAGKGKSKAKTKATVNNDDESGESQKRPGTPTSSPAKKQKKMKAQSSVEPRPGGPPRPPSSHRLGPPGSQPKPSKMRSTPTSSAASQASLSFSKQSPSRSRSPSDGSDSTVNSPSQGATPSNTSSVGFSPTLPSAEIIGKNRKNGKATGTGPPARPVPVPHLPSPKSIPPPPVRRESNYLMDAEGEETGSSSDTDSS